MTSPKDTLLKKEVAKCCRLFEALGLFDFSGHVSARVPGTGEIYINSRDSVRSKVGLDDIIKYSFKEGSLDKERKEPSEIFIHTEIYQSRPEINAVAHIHAPAVISFSILKKTFIPVIPRASVLAENVPIYHDSRLINTLERGQLLAKTLGKHKAVILRAHGAVVVAKTLKELFFNAVSLEMNVQHQIIAYQSGIEPEALSKEEIEEGKRIYQERLFAKLWEYHTTKLNLEIS